MHCEGNPCLESCNDILGDVCRIDGTRRGNILLCLVKILHNLLVGCLESASVRILLRIGSRLILGHYRDTVRGSGCLRVIVLAEILGEVEKKMSPDVASLSVVLLNCLGIRLVEGTGSKKFLCTGNKEIGIADVAVKTEPDAGCGIVGSCHIVAVIRTTPVSEVLHCVEEVSLEILIIHICSGEYIFEA